MATPSGLITAQDINKELANSLIASINLNDFKTRWLASTGGIPSAAGSILTFNDLRSKSAIKRADAGLTTSANSTTIYQFLGRGLGTYFPGRTIIICGHVNYNATPGTLVSCTVGSTTMTVYQVTHTDGTGSSLTFIAIGQPTGDTGDIIFNISGGGSGAISAGYEAFVVAGLNSLVPYAQGTFSGINTVATCTLNVPANGRVVVACTRKAVETTVMANATESVDLTNTDSQRIAGYETGLSLQSNRAITITGATSTQTSAIALSFDLAASAGIVAPVFRAQNFTDYTGGQTEAILTKPTGTVDNDIMIATLLLGRGGTVPTDPTPPAGWTLISRQTPSTGGFAVNFAAYWKRAASEGASYTFGFDGSYSTESHISSYSGCPTSGSPIDVFSSNTGISLTATGLSVTTTQANDLLIFDAHNWDASGTLSPPSGMTERHDKLTYQSDEVIAAAGATGDRVQTPLAGNNPWSAFLIALKGI